ncbi:hypothetical protein R1sor_020535 [Riccia sorocarpa]|uniref:Uncharacterized protein n=1 Tax=Riccia sorocarpa TaxID=122646 RepID=A0ABD3IFQ8_9MARC
MFELTLRAVDRLGTTEAFEKAFDITVRMTDPLKNIPHSVNGDINTTTYKRKGPTTSTIRPDDTHRHDCVAVISQVTRRVKGRLQFDFTTIHTISEDIPLSTQVSQITTISSSMDLSTELQEDDAIHEFSQQHGPSYFQAQQDGAEDAIEKDAAHPSDQQDGMANTHITELFSDSEVRHTHASEQARACQRACPVDAPPRTDQDSDNDVVVLRDTPRARPPTKAYPINVPTRDEMDDLQPVGVLQNDQTVVEQDVDKHFWHLSRIHPSGNPICNAAMTGRGPPRSLCKTKIKVSGRTVRGFATIASSFAGYTKFQGVERPRQFWFCPSMTCFSRSRGSLKSCQY